MIVLPYVDIILTPYIVATTTTCYLQKQRKMVSKGGDESSWAMSCCLNWHDIK